MKVLLNPKIHNYTSYIRANKPTESSGPSFNQNEIICNTIPYGYSPISFQSKCQANILLAQTKHLCCAFGNKPLIPQSELETIYEKLAKKTDVRSLIFYLAIYKDYMQKVERQVFEILKDYQNYGKKNFQDVLKEHYPNAMKRLKAKEINILNSANDLINTLDDDLAKKVIEIKDNAISQVSRETLCRKDVLQQLKELAKSSQNESKLNEIYKIWYNLPNSFRDMDAFIVEYSNYPHDEIAQKLLSSSVATLKAIKPLSEGGEKTLGNYILISKLRAKDSAGVPIREYLELNPDVKENIQKYVDEILNVRIEGRPLNIARLKYPQMIQKSFAQETNGAYTPIIEEKKRKKTNPLLKQLKYLPCAFSGKALISPFEIASIYEKLSHKQNVKSAVNYLQNYEDALQDVERKVFEMLKGYKNIETKDFQSILKEQYAHSYENLKEKELKILHKTDSLIAELDSDLAKKAVEIRDFAISKINNGFFNPKNVLKQIQTVEADGANKAILDKIYKCWHDLPRANNDYDAFIVKYSESPHEKIAQRLISPSVAVVKVLRSGDNNLGNTVIVSKRFDDYNGSSLKKYATLHPKVKIQQNLQKYLDEYVSEINKGTVGFSNRRWYPEAIRKSVLEASDNAFSLEVKAINPPNKSKKTNNGMSSSRYNIRNNATKISPKFVLKNNHKKQ